MVRRYVPLQLRAEISEYASLLRSLHTSDSLDVAVRLTSQSQPPVDAGSSTSAVSPRQTRSRSRRVVLTTRGVNKRPSSTTTGIRTRSSKRTKISTQWPLLPEDAPTPTWSLEDELRVLATHVLRSHNQTLSQRKGDDISCPDNEEQEDDDEDDDSIDAILPYLNNACTAHLTHILALLAAHVPRCKNSMQGRTAPITWESVLDIVNVGGACDVRTIENVQERLEAIYGPAKSRVVPNTDFRAILQEQFESVCTSEELDFLSFPSSPEAEEENSDEE